MNSTSQLCDQDAPDFNGAHGEDLAEVVALYEHMRKHRIEITRISKKKESKESVSEQGKTKIKRVSWLGAKEGLEPVVCIGGE